MTKILRANYDCHANQWTLGVYGLRLAATNLVQGDCYHLQVKFRNAPVLTTFTSALLCFKEVDAYQAGGDFDDSYPDFDTGDTFHDLANKQASIAFIASTKLVVGTEYYMSLVMWDEVGNKFETNVARVMIDQPMYVGTEASTPGGVVPPAITGTATITGSNTSVTVSVPGLTVLTGKVVISQDETDGGYVGAVTSKAAGSFTITAQSAPEITPGDGRTFAWTYWIVRK
jgi:hypothetical protein